MALKAIINGLVTGLYRQNHGSSIGQGECLKNLNFSNLKIKKLRSDGAFLFPVLVTQIHKKSSAIRGAFLFQWLSLFIQQNLNTQLQTTEYTVGRLVIEFIISIGVSNRCKST